jgi:hypothetical protein
MLTGLQDHSIYYPRRNLQSRLLFQHQTPHCLMPRSLSPRFHSQSPPPHKSKHDPSRRLCPELSPRHRRRDPPCRLQFYTPPRELLPRLLPYALPLTHRLRLSVGRDWRFRHPLSRCNLHLSRHGQVRFRAQGQQRHPLPLQGSTPLPVFRTARLEWRRLWEPVYGWIAPRCLDCRLLGLV